MNLMERRLSGLSAASSGRIVSPTFTQAALVHRSKRLSVNSSSHGQSSTDAGAAPASNSSSSSSLAASLRRVLNLPPKNDASPPNGADQRYRVFLDQWDKGFMEAAENPEGSFADVIYGEIPTELEGTLFRNGPGKFSLGKERIPHPYDGDGLVASIAFKDGTAFFRSRFVQTPEYKAEAAADSVLFRGTFATQRAGGSMSNAGDLYVKNTSNTNVVAFGDRLWTLFEAGQPFRLDPKTLETIGPELLDGLFKLGLPFDLGSKESNSMFATLTRLAQGRSAPAASVALSDEQVSAGGDAVTAHPHICPRTGRLVTFSYKVRPILPSSPSEAPFVTDFTFYELESYEAENKETKMRSVATRKYTLPGFAFLHDFALTENYYVIFQNPVTVENLPYMLGIAPAASCVRWVDNTPTYVHIIPRKQLETLSSSTTTTSTSEDVMVFSAPPLFVFHHANAYEEHNSSSVVIDSIHYDSLPAVGREALSQQGVDPDAAFSSRLRRVEIDLKTKILKIKCAFDGYLEMPAINPNFISKKHQYVYGYHSIFEDPQIGLAKINVEGREVEVWKPGKNRFALEPRFIPRNKGSNSSNNNTTTTTTTNTTEQMEEEVEDDGWLIAQLFDSNSEAMVRSEIVILDAQNLSQGPVAIVALRDPMPSALHACWSDTYYGPLLNKEEKKVDSNVVPFLAGEREKLKGSGSVRKSMPTGGSNISDSSSDDGNKVIDSGNENSERSGA